MESIDCNKCPRQCTCCETGAWVDLEEAKKILASGHKFPGSFFEFEKDETFPSGYRVGTSLAFGRCTFLTDDGLCSIHKVSYDLKPSLCKEFPLEKGKPAPFLDELCYFVKSKNAGREVKV
jgi:Fe-S-cluster containining protein